MRLSARLQMLADMVTPGNRVADVGCDHGFLSVWLVQEGISPYVLAMDVRKGPLAAAESHVAACGLGAYIETRLSDGLLNMASGEADTVVCAGMGGRLMRRILTDGREKARGLKELILQPQSELKEFRRFLRREGFCVTGEDAVFEDGKYYFAMRAVYAGEDAGKNGAAVCAAVETDRTQAEESRLFDEYGEFLLKRKHPVLKRYLLFREGVAAGLLKRLEAGDTVKAAERIEEIRREQAAIRLALCRFEDTENIL